MREFARATPRRTAVIDGDRTLTFAELDERASRLACHLLSLGLGSGDRVAVLLGNRLEYPEVAAGIAKAGLVLVPLNPRLTAPEAAYILEHSGARALVLDDALADRSWRTRPLPVLSIDGTWLGPSYDEALAAAVGRRPSRRGRRAGPLLHRLHLGDDRAPQGRADLAPQPCAHLLHDAPWSGTSAPAGSRPPSRRCTTAPGFAFGYAPVFTGGTVTMLRAWDPEAFLALVATRPGAVDVPGARRTPSCCARSASDASRSYDLSSLDTLYFNAAALPWPLKQWVMATFPDCRRPRAVRLDRGRHRHQPATGRHAHQARLGRAPVVPHRGPRRRRRRAAGAAGEPGELFSRSPYLMNGYHDDPDATAACTTEDGFVTCGDIVTLDDEGYVSIVDRKKDLIISGGVNIYPREVEEVLAAHPAVAEVAVVGVPDETWGETVVAHVVTRAGAPLDVAALDAHCRSHLAGFKVPRVAPVPAHCPATPPARCSSASFGGVPRISGEPDVRPEASPGNVRFRRGTSPTRGTI